MEHAGYLGYHKKTNLQIMGVEEGEEIKTKGIDYLFYRITAENFPNIKKERINLEGNTHAQEINVSQCPV
jgi:hypothetical protein